MSKQNALETILRIRVCVEAMEGIDDPIAARIILDEPRTAAATDMLSALKLAEMDLLPTAETTRHVVRQAIRSAEGTQYEGHQSHVLSRMMRVAPDLFEALVTLYAAAPSGLLLSDEKQKDRLNYALELAIQAIRKVEKP